MNPMSGNNVECVYLNNMHQSCSGVKRRLEESSSAIIREHGYKTLIGGSRVDKINQLRISGCFITSDDEIHCCLCHRTVAKSDKLRGEDRINLRRLHAEGCNYATVVEKYLTNECLGILHKSAAEYCMGEDYSGAQVVVVRK